SRCGKVELDTGGTWKPRPRGEPVGGNEQDLTAGAEFDSECPQGGFDPRQLVTLGVYCRC
ncbi:hypothetical protein, partial [Gordonia desulfuricans]|uniref:hypothetical protein n=1 Tax=Gordonia desulfuricans TaxID=89051 RepID=UPI000AE7CA19